MARRHGLVRHLVGDLSLPNSSPFAKLLDSSVRSRSARDARRIHARIIKTQFSSEIFIQNRLVDVYAKCDCLDDARKLFDKMPEKNAFSWNAIISGLTKWSLLDEAAVVFGSMPEPDQCSWNSMVAGFAQHDWSEEALEYFVGMHREDFVLNEYSFGSALSACSGLMDVKMGTQIHALISKSWYSSDVYMGSALIDMYSKCCEMRCAQKVFDGMIERNIVSWNSLITCYEQNGPASEALVIFSMMMDCGLEPDEVTLASVVSACASLLAIKEGCQIHARVMKFNSFRDDLVLGNALVDMYAKCGKLSKARWVFDRMPIRNVVSETSLVSGYAKAASVKAARQMFTKMMDRNVVSWNALIAGYTQNGENEEALGLFQLLKRESVWPTHYTFGNLLNACANLADLKLGRQAHTHILKHGFRFQSGPESDIFVGNSLVDMYMKCGSIEDGSRAFENMADRDYVSWNAMIVGYAQNGYAAEALEIFRRMLVSGERPDHVTMIGVLCACSHAGLVEEGRHYFLSMNKEHDIVPLKDHYTCMVDLLGRAGCLNEAKNLIEAMPMPPDVVVWGSLLAACKVHGNMELGKYVAEKLLEIDPSNSGPYVLLSNMYAELGRWGDVGRVRKMMRQQGVIKQPGCSWIEIQSHVHVFMVKDKIHPQRKEIYLLLKMLTKQMKRAGYVTDAVHFEDYDELAPSNQIMKRTLARYDKSLEASEASTVECKQEKEEPDEVDTLKDEIAKLQTKQLQLSGEELTTLSINELQKLEQELHRGLSSVHERKEQLLRQQLEQSRLQEQRAMLENETLRRQVEELRGVYRSHEPPVQWYLRPSPVERKSSFIQDIAIRSEVICSTNCAIEDDDSDTTLQLGLPSIAPRNRKARESETPSNYDSGSQ